jgi:DNA-binding transcriptional ArsR family regulator
MRRTIFERLAVKPAPVGELAETLPITRSAVSQHLRVLKEARLVADTQVGTRRIYRIDPRGIGAVRDWLDILWTRALTDFAGFADALGEEDNLK